MSKQQTKQNTNKQQNPNQTYYTKNQHWVVQASNKPWRPTKNQQKANKISNTLKKKNQIPQEKIDKIQEWFLNGLSKTEVITFANISTQTYYNRKDKKPELFEELEQLQKSPTIQAKINIADKINTDNDIKLSQRRLENSKDSEFNNKAPQNNYIQQNNYYNLTEEELDYKMQELKNKLVGGWNQETQTPGGIREVDVE